MEKVKNWFARCGRAIVKTVRAIFTHTKDTIVTTLNVINLGWGVLALAVGAVLVLALVLCVLAAFVAHAAAAVVLIAGCALLVLPIAVLLTIILTAFTAEKDEVVPVVDANFVTV